MQNISCFRQKTVVSYTVRSFQIKPKSQLSLPSNGPNKVHAHTFLLRSCTITLNTNNKMAHVNTGRPPTPCPGPPEPKIKWLTLSITTPPPRPSFFLSLDFSLSLYPFLFSRRINPSQSIRNLPIRPCIYTDIERFIFLLSVIWNSRVFFGLVIAQSSQFRFKCGE